MKKTPKLIDSAKCLYNIGIDYAEMIFDSFLEDWIIKEFPVFRLIVNLYKTGKSIKDYYSLRKLIAFLTGCHKIERSKIHSFLKTIEDKKAREKIGMQILLIVDKVDEIQKAELIGRALKLLVENQIDLEFYMRLCYMIEKCFYNDILILKNFTDADSIITTKNNKNINSVALEMLFSCGFISNYGFDGGDVSGENSGTRYGLNEYGLQLKKVL